MFTNNLTSWILPLLLPVAVLFSCCGTHEKTAERPARPENLTIVFGEGGGFSGQWQGYTIEPDGAILQWQGRAAGAKPSPAGMLNESAFDHLWNEIHDRDILQTTGTAPGNMTRFISITSGQETHRISWAMDAKDSGKTAELDKFYNLCGQIVEHKQ